VGREVGEGAGVLTAVCSGDGLVELGVPSGEVDAALGDDSPAEGAGGDPEHPSVTTTRESAVMARRIH